MDPNTRTNGHRITRLTISGGKRAEPRLMMAHPKHDRRSWLLVIVVIVAVLAIALAGRS